MADYREEADRFYASWAYGGMIGSLMGIFGFGVLLFIALVEGKYDYSILFFVFMISCVFAFVMSYRRAGKYEEYRQTEPYR